MCLQICSDLKPANLLLTVDGYLKLIDFDLAKCNMDAYSLTGTICGISDFFAPEIKNEKLHGRVVDWWSLGLLICVMSCGSNVNKILYFV